MLKIRLTRVGRRNQPRFRVVVTPHTAPPKSGYLEIIGNYNPASKKLEVNKKAAKEWLKKGAQMSTAVHNLFVKNKIIKSKKIKISREKSRKKKKKTKQKKSTKKSVKKPKSTKTEKNKKKD